MGRAGQPEHGDELNQKIYAQIEASRNRPHRRRPPVRVSRRHVVKRTWGGEVRNVSLLVASGVNEEGFGKCGSCEGSKEDKAGWSAFLRHLIDRGLKGCGCLSPTPAGVGGEPRGVLAGRTVAALRSAFLSECFEPVPASKVKEVSRMLKAIHAQENRDAADRKARAIVEDLRAARMNTAADLVERSVHETLTYYAFPDIHWQKIRTNNPLERIMNEIRRRTRVVGAFPDGQSCLNLAAARLRYIAGTAWSAKCYMNMRPLYQPQVPQTEAVA